MKTDLGTYKYLWGHCQDCFDHSFYSVVNIEMAKQKNFELTVMIYWYQSLIVCFQHKSHRCCSLSYYVLPFPFIVLSG